MRTDNTVLDRKKIKSGSAKILTLKSVPRKPGRPKPSPSTTQKPSVVEALLNSAELLIADRGFSTITLKDVSQHSSVNSAMVAYYFGNKDGLAKAVIEKQFQRIDTIIRLAEAASVQHLANSPTDDSENFSIQMQKTKVLLESSMAERFWSKVTQLLLENVEKEPHCHRIHMWLALEGGQLIQDVAHGVWNPVFEKLTGWLKKLRPDLNPDEIESRCSVYCGSFQQYANWLWVVSPALSTKTKDKKLLQKNYKRLLSDSLSRTLFS